MLRAGSVLRVLVVLGFWAWPSLVGAHSLPERFVPQRDAMLSTAPAEVRILFGGEIERAFSTIEVTDSGGHRVDKGNASVDEKNRQLLRVSLGPLSPGVYRVLWRILAVDGHRNEGTYVFTVKP
jgi:methionine-rich copper-binding protein CopC